MDLPALPEDAKADSKAFGGWIRRAAVVVVQGMVHGDRAEVAARRKELARQWATAKRRGDDVSAAAVAALLAVMDELLSYLAAMDAIRVERDSVASRLLQAVTVSPGVREDALSERTGVEIGAVSREGGRLEDRGLVVRRRVGRQRHWELTPRGRAAVERLGVQ